MRDKDGVPPDTITAREGFDDEARWTGADKEAGIDDLRRRLDRADEQRQQA